MITGGVVAVINGDPRFTRDVDLVLEPQRDRVATLLAAFESDTFPLRSRARRPHRRPHQEDHLGPLLDWLFLVRLVVPTGES